MVERYRPPLKKVPVNWERALARMPGPTRTRVDAFTPREDAHPPGVRPPGTPTMAQDQTINFSTDWAASALQASLSEGVQFVGYPYLAELAQRPEYRVISQTIAEEMTRKWLKFEASGEDDKDTEDLDDDEDPDDPSLGADPRNPEPNPEEEAQAESGRNFFGKSDNGKTDRIKELEEFWDELNVRECAKTLVEQDGYFGRAHLYLDTGDTDNRDELKRSIGNGKDAFSKMKVNNKKKRLLRLKTVEAVWCYPTNYESSDPLKPNWYKPEHWFVMGKELHASRLMTFVGQEVPDLLKPAYSFGGLSMSQMAMPYVNNWLQTRQSVNDLIQAFVVWGLKTNLAESVQLEGNQLFARLELFNRLRNNRGVMALDKDTEEFFNVTASLSGLESLQAQSQEHMAAVSRIPLVKLLGISPTGLNASSEGEIRVFYDTIHGRQESFLTKPLRRLMHFSMLSLWGEIDPDIGLAWNPLFALDESQQASVEETRARTAQIWIEGGVIDKMEERRRVAEDPSTPYPGLDPDLEPEPPPQEEGAEGAEGGPPQGIPGMEGEEGPENALGGPESGGGENPSPSTGGGGKPPQTLTPRTATKPPTHPLRHNGAAKPRIPKAPKPPRMASSG